MAIDEESGESGCIKTRAEKATAGLRDLPCMPRHEHITTLQDIVGHAHGQGRDLQEWCEFAVVIMGCAHDGHMQPAL